MIDMHAHWRPVEAADALRERTREPRIAKNSAGAEVMMYRGGEEPIAEAFDSVEEYLERMDRQGVGVAHTGELRIGQPALEFLAHHVAGFRGVVLPLLGQRRQVGAEPLVSLLPPAQALHFGDRLRLSAQAAGR